MGPFTNIKKSRSFNAVQSSGNANFQQHVDADDKTISSLIHDVNEQTSEDLQETITALRQSIATHANANAETLEHFTTLQKAHDTLYSEHLSLQEQMDDAVELLKYLKEEKCSNESKIKKLSTEIGVLKESASGKVGVVVSSTIENLTKEKMELEEALKEMEEGRQDAMNNVEHYEIERKEMMDRLSEFGMDGTQEEGLTQKLALIYEQASSHKEQIRKLEEQSKQRGNLQNLLSQITEEKDKASESITKLQLEKDSLMKEQETMKSQLRSIQQQEEEISRLNVTLSDSLSAIAQLKRERNNSITPAEGHNELLLENESLKYKIQDLQDQIGNYSHSAAQKDEVHTQLEREMQERLAKRLAVQLHESKLAMESQIRKELEKEYQSSSSSAKNKSKSFHDAGVSAPQANGQGSGAIEMQLEIEKNLRMQLQQVKEERERWTKEQEEFQGKVLLSQQQLSQVRDGYKKKLDREKIRVKELESSVSDRESVIGKLSDEYRRAMDELDELQMRQSSIQETLKQKHGEEIQELQLSIDRLRNGQSGQDDKYNKLKKEMDTLKQKYHDNDEELQTTLSQLEQLNLENEEYVRKLEVFESSTDSSMKEGTGFEELQAEHSTLCTQHNELKQKYEGQKEELDTTLQQLEALNVENDDYLRKNVAFEMTIEAEKKSAVEIQKRVQSLDTDNNKLTLDLSKSEEERKKLEQSQLETKKLYSETETRLKASIEEMEQSQSVIKDSEAKQKVLEEERDKISAELNAGKEKLSSLAKQYETVTHEKEEHLSSVQALTKEIDELRSTIVSSEVAWQDRIDSKVNEISDSHKKAVQNYEEKIGALNSEIVQLKEAKSVIDGQNEENIGRIKELEEEKTKLNTKDSSQIMCIQELKQEKIQLEESVKQLERQLSSVADENEALITAQSDKVQALISEKDEVASACDTKVAVLTKERDELSGKITSLENEAEEYKLQTLDKIDLLSKDRDELLEKIVTYENASREMSASSQALQKEQESLREMLKQSDLAKQEVETKLSELSSTNCELKQEKIDLSTKIEQLKQSCAESLQIDEQKNELLSIELEQLKEVNSELTNEIATLITTEKESSASSQAEIDKLKIELDDAQDKCRVLEGGLEDLQLEKEDFETENEELASKLADLTSQAKTMLVRNEEMENQLDELAMEYDSRVSELESQLCDLHEKLEEGKSICDENEELEVLRQKHEKALETIVNLKTNIDEAQQNQDEKEVDLKRLMEVTLELRQVIDHLQSENDAAREIKYIVLDLKTKNMELTEIVRTSREQKKAAAEIIERLKTENENLTNNVRELHVSSANRQMVNYAEKETAVENQLVPFEAISSGDEKRIQEMDAELTHYKAIVDKMMSDRSIFTQRLSEMMDSAPLKRRNTDCDGQFKLDKDVSATLNTILQEKKGDSVAMLTSGPRPPFVSQGALLASSPASTQESHIDSDKAKAKIQNLTAENVDLAQRLGGAVAEKEFAMTTLSKIGSKMEELIERNKLLESIADLKSSYAIREGSVYSGASRGHSMISLIQDKSHGRAPLDPDEYVGNSRNQKSPSAHELDNTTTPTPLPQSNEPSLQLVETGRHDAGQSPYYGDANSAFGDSTIMSYEPPVKRLEPEQHVKGYLTADVSVEKRNFKAKNGVDDSKDSLVISGNSTSVYGESTCSSDLKTIKVPGGEYFGQMNSRGQKHGNGKILYDNGNEYDGQWKNNKRDGKGTTRYASGNVYIGMWKVGKRHGFGVFHIEKSGDIYRGNWSGGIKSGPGVYEYADGELDVSFYSNDIRVGDGVRWTADRCRASRLCDGKLIGLEGDFPVDDAMRLTKKLGFVV